MAVNWTLMGTHGIVLFYVAANPESTMKQMAETLSITERRIAQVVGNLSEAGMLTIRKVGRRNFYAVNPDASFRHPTLSHISLGKLFEALEVA